MMQNRRIFKNTIRLKRTLFGGLLCGMLCCSPTPESPAVQSAETSRPWLSEEEVRLSNDVAKTEIFRDAGLGLFIHWGPNSQLGSEISWPLNNASPEYIEKYYTLAETFDPKEFNAAEWAHLAKLAGMEYVVFTSKHHDGFCMFDTEYSDFKITNTPFKRDIVQEIVSAFRSEGLLVGLYYSPGDFRYFFETGAPLKHLMTPDFASSAVFGPKKAGFLEYEQGHVRELLTRYGDIFMLWFDGTCEPLKKYAWRIQQDLFIGRGEIPTPEQTIPGKADDFAWESCMTTSWQWSYQPHPDVRTTKDILQNLIQIRARGGNMLLNVGPHPDGRIAPPDEALLRDLGLWMMAFGEAVRSVRPWIVTNEDDIWLTKHKSQDTVYAFVDLDFDWEGVTSRQFSGREITLQTLQPSENTRITVLGQSGECEWTQDEQGLHIKIWNRHTVQFIARPFPKSQNATSDREFLWGPDWPVAVKMTHITPSTNED
jgi:alpha-L-fucosidase